MFLDDLMKEQALKSTENGATALNTTGSHLLDMFSLAGAMRKRSDEDIMLKYFRALTEDKALATKLAFYTRDVRGGLGERNAGRLMFRVLAKRYPELLSKNISNIAEFGRYDDLVELLDTPVRDEVVEYIKSQLNKDCEDMTNGKPVSLLAKWLPSVNTSSYASKKKAKELCGLLGLSEKEYRKMLASLRAYLNVLEVRMTEKDYAAIRYEQVPSKAMNIHTEAFIRHDKARFESYLENVKSGKEKINSSVLYPYDITEKFLDGMYAYKKLDSATKAVLEEQWKNLPNYCEGEKRYLVMADVSGSMNGRPLATSLGLAIYFAERNKGTFANKFMTFSARPELVDIKGDTLEDKLSYSWNTHWEMNTNLHAAFELILRTAVKYHAPKEEMPESLIVISDMEIDRCSDIKNWVFYDQVKAEFENAGYDIPNIVFWNVDARNDTFLASLEAKGVQLASGQSASTFKNICTGLGPYEFMLKVLNDKRYDCIVVE